MGTSYDENKMALEIAKDIGKFLFLNNLKIYNYANVGMIFAYYFYKQTHFY